VKRGKPPRYFQRLETNFQDSIKNAGLFQDVATLVFGQTKCRASVVCNNALLLNGFDDEEQNLTFVKTDFQVLKPKFHAYNTKQVFYPHNLYGRIIKANLS